VPVSNILVHLAPCEIIVNFDDSDYPIPAMTAHQWCQILLGDPFDPYDVFPLLAGADAVIDVEDAIDRKTYGPDDVSRIAHEIITVAGDRPWWVTLRMLSVAAQVWDRIGAVLVREGVDSRHLSLAAWLDAIWSIMLSYIERDNLQSWLSQMEVAPTGWADEIDFDEQERAFIAAMKSAR
jgi:hypothetical protein